jgi:hypothetical protein
MIIDIIIIIISIITRDIINSAIASTAGWGTIRNNVSNLAEED